MWSHSPLLAVNRLAIFFKIALSSPQRGGLHVVIECEARIDIKLAIVFPLVGVAHLYSERVELNQGINLSLVAHPVKVSNAFGKSFAQVANEFHHLLLAVASEVFLYVELTHSLAHNTAGHTHSTFPASLALLLATEGATIEIETGLSNLVAEVSCGTGNDATSHVVFNLLVFEVSHQLVSNSHHLGLLEDELFHVADAHEIKILFPVDGRIIGLKLVDSAQVI